MTASLKKQRQGIASALEEKVALYTSNYKEQINQWQEMMQDCQNALDNYNKQLAAEKEAVNKNNADIAEACNELQAFGQNPTTGAAEDLAVSLGKVIQLQAATPIGSAFNYADMIALGEIRSFNSSCGSSKDEDSSIYIPGGSKEQNKVTPQEYCIQIKKNGSDINELYTADVVNEVKELCNYIDSNSVECNDEVFRQQASDLCALKDENQNTQVGNCTTLGNNASELDPNNNDHVSKALRIANSPVTCDPRKAKEVSKSRKEKIKELRNYVSGYNCLKDRERAGEIKVSVCNATLANSMMNAKGLGISTAENVGKIIGSSGLIK